MDIKKDIDIKKEIRIEPVLPLEPFPEPVTETKPAIRFNNEKIDPILKGYHLGNGYRFYHPKLMRFLAPDNLSPFDEGGINPYCYCVGNPINLSDPTGHLSGAAIAGITIGVFGLILSIFTFGAAAMVAAGMASSIIAAGSLAAAGVSALSATTNILYVTSAVLGIASSALGISSSIIRERGYEGDGKLAADLGWAALGTGIASLLTGIGAAAGSSALNRATTSNVTIVPNQFPVTHQLGRIQIGSGGIRGHGYPFNVIAGFGGSRAVDGTKLARLTAQYTAADESIYLASCFGGYGGRFSAGQLLANQTGKTVQAGSSYIRHITLAKDLNRTFHPLTGISRQTSDLTGRAISGLVRSSMQGQAVLYRAPLQLAELGIVGTYAGLDSSASSNN